MGLRCKGNGAQVSACEPRGDGQDEASPSASKRFPEGSKAEKKVLCSAAKRKAIHNTHTHTHKRKKLFGALVTTAVPAGVGRPRSRRPPF